MVCIYRLVYAKSLRTYRLHPVRYRDKRSPEMEPIKPADALHLFSLCCIVVSLTQKYADREGEEASKGGMGRGWAIAVHGGAGVDPNLPPHFQQEAKQLLARCLDLGASALRSPLPAIDVVELVVRVALTVPVSLTRPCFLRVRLISSELIFSP